MNAFEDRLAKAVTRAEEALRKAETRLETALREYDAEVARREERGDGFTSTTYLVKRREAVLARKFYEAKRSALSTAIARRDAPRLGGGRAVAARPVRASRSVSPRRRPGRNEGRGVRAPRPSPTFIP